jgi:hypothetical protein
MGIMRAKYNTFLRGASAPLFLWAISGCRAPADPNGDLSSSSILMMRDAGTPFRFYIPLHLSRGAASEVILLYRVSSVGFEKTRSGYQLNSILHDNKKGGGV